MRSLKDFSLSLFSTPAISCKTTDLAGALQRIVDNVPDSVLNAIAADLEENLKKPEVGSHGMSARQVLCMALIKQMEGHSYRDLPLRVEDSVCLRKFAGYEFNMVPQKSALQANISAIREQTWQLINDAIVRFGMKQQIDSPEKIRIDTTNTQTDIHLPTDASLLYDAVRVIACSCERIRMRWGIAFEFHNRTRACKKLSFRIGNAKSAEQKTKLYGKLVALAEETLTYGTQAWKALRACVFKKITEQALARRYAEELENVCDLLRRVIDQTDRRVFKGESVPAEEKVVSIFEPHTDILEKGKRQTEFGHKVCLTMGRKLISTVKRVGAGLTRCLWEGSEHFAAYVWSVVTAFNVKAIARELMDQMAQSRKKARLARC